MIMGTGFPPFRGGLLRYADSVGVEAVVNRLKTFEARLGERFAPAPSLLKRAQSESAFYESLPS
jgi:3-hydroxyacyl-CoA dehydrogenase/enoyl-CoA hydratase/3-hydroxybutyryl-CoA epimerase